jgi:uncharacterized protein YndB with AHSA1/START domain
MATAAATSSIADLDPRELVITRVFAAPPALVFAAWTDPWHLARWFGPPSHPAHHVEVDLRPGGAWRACLRAADGSGDLWNGGVYREIVAPERLVFTFAWDHRDGTRGPETLITATFAPLGDKTVMTFRQRLFPTPEQADDHREGWNGSLDRLDNYLPQATERAR